MGPTASGKTHLALTLASHLPCDIISVDSAMVYRGMDIGTAKPTLLERASAPHQLIDILDVATPYSAGQFCSDAIAAIEKSIANDRVPLLVGGTMLYFRALQRGLSPLPSADPAIREQILQEATQLGWAALHQRLQAVDPVAAARISPEDAQRIQRALEVHTLTGMSLTEFCEKSRGKPAPYRMMNLALMVEDRAHLAQRIAMRFKQMLQQGFVAEVEGFKKRGDLHRDMPSMRAVGYRQVWDYLSGDCSANEMQERAIIATRQLAKRQITWLRSWPDIVFFEAEQSSLVEKMLSTIKKAL